MSMAISGSSLMAGTFGVLSHFYRLAIYACALFNVTSVVVIACHDAQWRSPPWRNSPSRGHPLLFAGYEDLGRLEVSKRWLGGPDRVVRTFCLGSSRTLDLARQNWSRIFVLVDLRSLSPTSLLLWRVLMFG